MRQFIFTGKKIFWEELSDIILLSVTNPQFVYYVTWQPWPTVIIIKKKAIVISKN